MSLSECWVSFVMLFFLPWNPCPPERPFLCIYFIEASSKCSIMSVPIINLNRKAPC